MADTLMAAGLLSPKQRKKHRRRKGNILFYSMVVFAVCWLQLSANIFLYYLRYKNNYDVGSRAGPFPLRPRSFAAKADSNRLLRDHIQSDKKKVLPSISSLEAQLLQLTKRLEQIQEIQQHSEETSASFAEKEKIFIAFTIRDAQRTVPTQIPHGFEVFDFIDVYATNGNQNQTAATHTRSEAKDGVSGDSHTPSNTNYRLFRNGKPVSINYSRILECPGYSKKCYRSKFLVVIRHLLSLHKNNHKRKGNQKSIEYYYFYMEADNDLCVPLSEIRDLAFKHQRYFISTGIGASGWVMSHRFLEDFHFFWNSIDENNRQGLSGDQIFEPDSVAAHFLQQNLAWSVTRRYLTSHSILKETTNDETSIAALFERIDPPTIEKDNAETKPVTSKLKRLKKHKKAAKKAPLMEPSRYLPRCLEPHRGVWRKHLNQEINKSENDFDIQHWGFFDYDLCPHSDIFPCAEGQLKELAKKDPYFHKSHNRQQQ